MTTHSDNVVALPTPRRRRISLIDVQVVHATILMAIGKENPDRIAAEVGPTIRALEAGGYDPATARRLTAGSLRGRMPDDILDRALKENGG